MAEKTGKSTGVGGRANLGAPWKKGQSGNPGGRPRLSAEAREWIETNGGAMDVLSLRALQRAIAQAKNLSVSVKASEVWLSKRLPEQLEVINENLPLSGIDWSKVSTEKLRALRDLAVAISAEQRDGATSPADAGTTEPRGD